MSELATLQIKVDASGAIRVVDQFGTSVEKATKTTDALRESAKRMGLAVGAVAAAGLALAVKNTIEAEKVQAQLAAALRSTGGAAGQSMNALNDHAEALARVTAFGDEAIGSAQALLLTFTKIGGEVFPQATATVLDMATALGTDATSAAMQLGKALNDPLVGITALGRAGVQFDATQKAQIKNFVETNQLAKAQAIILNELQTQVGGSAAAYRNTLGGALEAVKESFGNLFEVSSPGMKGLVESVNLLADMIGMIPTRLEQAKTGMASFLNRAGIALLEFNQRGRPSTMLDNMRQRQTQLDTDMAGLAALAAEQYQAVIDAAVARAKAGLPKALGGAVPDEPTIAAAAEAVNKFDGNVKALAGSLAEADKAAEKLDAALKTIGETAKAVETQSLKNDRNLKGSMGELKTAVDAVSESVRVFQEQTQIALGRFFADFLKSGTQSLGAFWEQFKQLGREAIGNVLAKSVMEKIGKPLGDAAMGAFGALKGAVGGSGLGVIGVVGGVVAGVLSKWSQTSKWEEAAETFNKAARAQEKAAGQLAMAAEQGRAKFLDDFLNYANTETATEREVRSLRNRRNDLGQSAFDLAKAGGGVYSNQLNQLIQQRRFAEAIAVARRDATSFNAPGSLGEKSLLDFAKALEELEKAFQANTKAATDAVKAEQWAAKQRQADSLQQFRDSLNLSAQSPLSPTGQLAEARRQYEVILALAKAGDESAISSLPETARTLLDASRAVNASGARYASDFAAVQADTLGIIEALRTQATEPQDVADGILERIDPWFEEQISIAASSLTVQQVGFQSVVDELVNVRAELSTMKNALKLSLDDVAAAL